ncbi:MAG: GAF domain-containing protein, partial [Actinobacteria bacterium]|nr:GAF domain-containing protein [Actinomycetota bacterium]
MTTETQAVLFNAVPLLVTAALYLAVGLTLAPALWRSRERSSAVRLGLALVFPSSAAAAGIVATEVLLVREPLGGHLWVSLVAILLAAVPALVLLLSWRDQGALVSGVRRTREAEERSSLRERELEAVGRLSRALLNANHTESVARALLDELARLFELDVANLCLIEGTSGRQARIVVARDRGRDNEALVGQVVDLDRETSGISTAVREAVAFAVFDAEGSPVVNKRLNEIAQVKSCAFVPVVAAERVVGVVFAAVRKPRVFGEDELALMQSFAAEAGLALQRVQSAAALSEALERERLIARFSLELRSQRDLDELLRHAVAEIAKALGVVRCFIRLGEPGGPMPVVAEWEAEGASPLGDASRLPVSNLAARERRTIAVGDVLEAPELTDPDVDLSELVERGERASLATPVVAFDRVIGVLGLHRSEPLAWTDGEISLAEAVAREAAIAIDTSRLLRESDRRVAEQRALLKAGEALTSDLRFDAVIERLVKEIRALVHGDAADCWTFVPGGGELVCRAVLGLPETEVGRRIPVQGTIGEAIASGTPVLRRDFATTEQPPPAGTYATFAEVMDAPIFSFGEIRGVLGVWSREAGRFEESDLRLIEAFASLASVALRNAEAYEESRRQTQVERAFYRIAAVLSEPLSAEATLDAVAQAAAEALGGDSAAVLRMAGGEPELAGGHELAPGFAEYLATEASPLIACARAGKVLASRSLRDDGRFGEGLAAAAEKAGRRSLLAVPLAQPGDEGLGLVLVFFRGERVFDDDELELAGHVAGAARGALERSELYERERRSRSLAQRLA